MEEEEEANDAEEEEEEDEKDEEVEEEEREEEDEQKHAREDAGSEASLYLIFRYFVISKMAERGTCGDDSVANVGLLPS